MTRIDFYHEAEDRLAIACRLVAKAFQQQLRVVIYAPRAEVADAVDRMLWISPSIGFLPHVRADHRLALETPILIAGEDSDPLTHDDVLINLDDKWPPAFSRFQRLIEIVSRDETDKQQARARFRFYKDRGYPIHTHNLAARA